MFENEAAHWRHIASPLAARLAISEMSKRSAESNREDFIGNCWRTFRITSSLQWLASSVFFCVLSMLLLLLMLLVALHSFCCCFVFGIKSSALGSTMKFGGGVDDGSDGPAVVAARLFRTQSQSPFALWKALNSGKHVTICRACSGMRQRELVNNVATLTAPSFDDAVAMLSPSFFAAEATPTDAVVNRFFMALLNSTSVLFSAGVGSLKIIVIDVDVAVGSKLCS